jgi:hypothetical protein
MLAAISIVGLGFVDGSADEHPHPTLVDAATTRCTVCHTTVATTHVGEEMRGRPCLDCHAFNDTRDGTSLTTEAAGATVLRSADASSGPEGDRTSSPRVATTVDAGTASRAGTRPATAAPPESSPSAAAPPAPESAEVAPTVVDPTVDRTRQLYVDGLHAFNGGRFDDAFETWRVMLAGNPGSWVLQVEIDSLITSAQSTLARFGDHGLYVVKKDGLHYVLSGVHGSKQDAVNALRVLPQALRSGGAFPIEAREILAGR